MMMTKLNNSPEKCKPNPLLLEGLRKLMSPTPKTEAHCIDLVVTRTVDGHKGYSFRLTSPENYRVGNFGTGFEGNRTGFIEMNALVNFVTKKKLNAYLLPASDMEGNAVWDSKVMEPQLYLYRNKETAIAAYINGKELVQWM